MFNFLNIPFFINLVEEINTLNYFYIVPISIFLVFAIIKGIRSISNQSSKDEDK